MPDMLNSWDFSGFKSSQPYQIPHNTYQMGIISILTVQKLSRNKGSEWVGNQTKSHSLENKKAIL